MPIGNILAESIWILSVLKYPYFSILSSYFSIPSFILPVRYPLQIQGHIGESKLPELLCDFFPKRRGKESVHLLRQQLDAGESAVDAYPELMETEGE